MKILFISALEIKEKGAQSIRMTLEGYAEHGHDVYLLTHGKSETSDYFYENEYSSKKNNFKIIRFWLPFGKIAARNVLFNFLRNIFLFIAVASFKGLFIAKKEKVDLIYGYEVQGIAAARVVAILTGKKMISRFQGTVLHPLLERKGDYKKKWLWTKYFYHRLAFRVKTDLYIMTNDGTLGDVVLKYFKAPKEKVRFWMNGVNKSIYQPKFKDYLRKKYHIPKEATILITVHRLTYWKRTDRAIKSLSNVLEKNKNVYLVIVGDGDRKTELENMVRKLKLTKNVFFAGGVPNEEVGKYLNGADIYLGTYDLSNAGNPLFESMLSGLAVISLNNGSTADFLGNGQAGILIDSDKYFTSKILALVGDKKELEKWKKLAKDYSHQNFWTWAERIDTEIKEVERLLDSSKK